MVISRFVGTLSPFQVIVSAAALFTTFYTFILLPVYRLFRRRPLAMFSADGMAAIYRPQDGAICGFHLRAAVVNRSHKMATLTRLDGEIIHPSGPAIPLRWKLFFKYTDRGLERVSDAYPISVNGESSVSLLCEMARTTPDDAVRWLTGEYRLRLTGQVNASGWWLPLEHERRFSLSEEMVMADGLAAVGSQHPSIQPIQFN